MTLGIMFTMKRCFKNLNDPAFDKEMQLVPLHVAYVFDDDIFELIEEALPG